jgi:hypothetical protein
MHNAYKMLMCLVVSILLRCVQEEHWWGEGAQEGFYLMCIALNKNQLDFFFSPLHLLNFCNVGNFLVKLDQLLGRVCISNFKFWPFEGCKEQQQSWRCLLQSAVILMITNICVTLCTVLPPPSQLHEKSKTVTIIDMFISTQLTTLTCLFSTMITGLTSNNSGELPKPYMSCI